MSGGAFNKAPACVPAAVERAVNSLQRFHVSITRPDGSTDDWTRIGGTSVDHTLDAMVAAGLGGAVRVVPLDLQGAP